MAVRPNEPRQGATAVLTAALAMAAWLAAPVLAAPDRDLLGSENAAPELEASATTLTATPVSNPDDLLDNHLLRSNTESAARSAFSEEEPERVDGDHDSEDDVDALATDPVLPSVSDREQSPYKRQMYRRDI